MGLGKTMRGLFESVFPKGSQDKVPELNSFFKALTAYRPSFTNWNGELYESELVRASIDAFARAASKLSVSFNGSGKTYLKALVRTGPNSWMSWGQFLYRLATILLMQNNAFIVPILDGSDAKGGKVVGYFPVLPSRCELLEDEKGEAWIRYSLHSGRKAAIEYKRCGVVTRHQYKDDFFGESNNALRDTMQLMDIQRQGIQEGVRNSATFRFMAKINNFSNSKDLANERKRFDRDNLQADSGGILLFPNTYADIKQIESKPYVIDQAQMQIIQNNVYSYFGVNVDVLQNKCFGDAWNAFYEGAIEPFAIQLSDVMTRMTFTEREVSTGNSVFFSSNRLQYMSNADKLSVSTELADRGLIMLDEAREIWNLPPLPDGQGQRFIIRGEYHDAYEHLAIQDEGSGDNAGDSGQGIQSDEADASAGADA